MEPLLMFFFVLVGIQIVGVALRLRPPRRPAPGAVPQPRVDPCLGPAAALPPEPVCCPEDVLYARLAAGDISQSRYRERIATLAARDDRRHPVAVPPSTRPGTP